jgi:hypothetical protein
VSRQGRRSLRLENADECCASAAWSNDSGRLQRLQVGLADELLWRAASERRETAVPEYRLPQRGHGLRYHELRCLDRIV